MKLTAKAPHGETPNGVRGALNNQAEMEAMIVLGAFENELDSLKDLAASEGSGTVAEAVIRRYQSAEQLMSELEDAYDRLRLKMHLVRERIIGGVSARDLLESSRE